METADDACASEVNQELEIQWYTSQQSGDIPPDEESLPCEERAEHARRDVEDILQEHENSYDEPDTTPSGVEDEDPETLYFSSSLSIQYKMNHKHRGLFVIFNHETFSVKARDRIGTNVDRDNLLETATHLGFRTISHDNLTVQNIEMVMNEYANHDYSDYDCFACAILTHGGSEDYLYAKNGTYALGKILEPFRKTGSLIGKPKLFFIQACRGKLVDEGVVKGDETDAGASNDDDAESNQTFIPMEADFFIGYSTVEGYLAWRNKHNGSWFIKALCYCLKKYAERLDLLQIMTRVNRMVAYDYESNDPECRGKKQMPSIVTRLTACVYFRRNHTDLNEEATDGLLDKVMKKTKELGSSQCKGTMEKRPSNGNETEVNLLQAELELSKILRKKAEIEQQEQDLRQKIIQCKLNSLKK